MNHDEMVNKYGYNFYIDKKRNVLVVIENWIYKYYCMNCGNELNGDSLDNLKETGYYTREVSGNCNKCGEKCSYTG